ncbi:MAG TPA: POTRA domain-containing protein, partial [Acidobacteriaceae bacterium]
MFLLLAGIALCRAQSTSTSQPDPSSLLNPPQDSLNTAQAGTDQTQAATPPGGTSLPGAAAFAGSKVTGVRFDGVQAPMLGPLPSQLELQTGDTLTEEKLKASLKRLYDSGLYDTIQVQGMRSDGGVLVVFTGRPRLFIGRVQIFGVNNERLQAQLEGSARLQPGTRYTQRKLDNSQASIEQALTDSGFYQATVERRLQLDAPN